MKPFVFAVLFIAAQAVQFEVKDKNGTVCLLLQLDGVLNIEALHNGTVAGKTSLNFTNATEDNQSNCTTIKLNLEKKAEVWFQFKEDGNVSSVIPQAKFDSKTALSLNETETVEATAEALTFPKDKSFLCKSSVDHAFKINNGTFKYTYNVDAVISNFQIQSGDIKNSSFGPSQDCQEDTPTTPATTAATSTAVTTAATTTPVPNEDIFRCVIDNVTKFLFKANMSLAITYEAKEGNATVNTTAYIDVPLFTRNDTSCENPLEEVLNIYFLDNWILEFVFQREKNTSSDFYVSHITLNYTTASLKNAVKNETLFANYTASDNTFLKSSGGSYYVCRANSSVDLNKNAKLSTSQLYYRAFNDKGDIQFTGDATECSADEETSSVVPIAVGAALAGLVVIVLIAYLIGRRRSRKAGYESV